MTVNAITDTKKGRTGIAPTYLHTTPPYVKDTDNTDKNCKASFNLSLHVVIIIVIIGLIINLLTQNTTE